jgi:acyl-CoA ligase (AMP-forming) (exosortase A-associated)
MDFLVHHMLRTTTSLFPKKEALVHGTTKMTYEEIYTQSQALAYSLQKAGIRRGDRVGIYLDPSTSLVLSLFGVSMAGAVSVPIHHKLFPEQVEYILNDCTTKALIVDGNKLSRLDEHLKKIHSLEFLAVVDCQEERNGTPNVSPFERFCKPQSNTFVKEKGIDRDLAAILYTSGSSGRPKGVMLSHRNILAGTSIVSDYLQISNSDRILAALPFSFDAGLNQLMTSVQKGGTLVLANFLFASDILRLLASEQITGMGGVPTFWSLLADRLASLENQSLNLRYITNTGGHLPNKVLETLRQKLPETDIYLMYGFTEAFRSTYLPPKELSRRPASMGKAVPNTEILILNTKGETCLPGEIGELIHHGPTVSQGYWNKPEQTAAVFKPHPFSKSGLDNAYSVCYSGDLVKMDKDGFLYFVGRRDNQIKSSGFRISPTEIEEVLMSSGQLRETAAIGVPDELLGEHIKAFVSLKINVEVEADFLIKYCTEQLPPHMVPKSIIILDDLPKTPNGKIDYQSLKFSEQLDQDGK